MTLAETCIFDLIRQIGSRYRETYIYIGFRQYLIKFNLRNISENAVIVRSRFSRTSVLSYVYAMYPDKIYFQLVILIIHDSESK